MLGKLSPAGLLTDIANRGTITWGDGSVDVQVLILPDTPGPYRYDAPTKAAIQLVKVPLLTLITNLTALTTAQKNAIWTDVTSGNPPKWELDSGPNAAALVVLQFLAQTTTLNAADLLAAKIRGVAMYVQDNPRYLINPAFDATINVPGLV